MVLAPKIDGVAGLVRKNQQHLGDAEEAAQNKTPTHETATQQ